MWGENERRNEWKFKNIRMKANESWYKQCGVTPHF